MNFAGSIVDNFIMLRFLHQQELIFGRSTLQKRKSWLPKLVIFLPVKSWFRNSEVLCKITSHTVHCHDTEAAILKNLQWKAGKGAEENRVEWEFTTGTAIFRSFREKRNTSEDFHLFRKLSGGMSCTIWISNRNFRFLLTNGKRPWRHIYHKFDVTVIVNLVPMWFSGSVFPEQSKWSSGCYAWFVFLLCAQKQLVVCVC